jgi:hypothetical protein
MNDNALDNMLYAIILQMFTKCTAINSHKWEWQHFRGVTITESTLKRHSLQEIIIYMPHMLKNVSIKVVQNSH